MFVKFCGFTRAKDLVAAKELGISAAGFIFYKKSKRYIPPSRAADLVRALAGSSVRTVGVFVDASDDEILKTVVLKSKHLLCGRGIIPARPALFFQVGDAFRWYVESMTYFF